MRCRDCQYFLLLADGFGTCGFARDEVVEAKKRPCSYFWAREEGETALQIAPGDEFFEGTEVSLLEGD